jgi:hypothetical protein
MSLPLFERSRGCFIAAHAWVVGPACRIIGEVMDSMARYRNIEPGEEFEGYE